MGNLTINLIKELYYNQELTTKEIARKLKVKPWKVWEFMVKEKIPRRTLSEVNFLRYKDERGTFSLKKKLSLREEKLKVAGIMLYWAEGARFNEKTSKIVDFTNSNPEMIKIFLEFLRIICGVEEKRLRVFLYCYSNQDIEKLKKYWYKLTNISLKQFTKPYVRKSFSLEKNNKMKYGLIHIRYGEMKLLLQIEKWIQEYLKKH